MNTTAPSPPPNPPSVFRGQTFWPWCAWSLLAVALLSIFTALSLQSYRFGYAFQVYQMPLSGLVLALLAAGIVYLSVVILIPASLKSGAFAKAGSHQRLLIFVLGMGLLMRLVFMASEPLMEDDYQRYLWDGAVTAAGLNPYGIKPQTALAAQRATQRPEQRPAVNPSSNYSAVLGELANKSGKTLERVNHNHLRTIYPPTAQGAFALAHVISPFSLTAWRVLCLFCEIATIGLILLMLHETGRPLLWSVLYWWNPVAIKELINSAHMDALLPPLLLGTLYLTLRARPIGAAVTAMFAVGTKLWPVLLLPLVFSRFFKVSDGHIGFKAPKASWTFAIAVILCAGLAALFAWPVLSAGLDDSSGFVAYSKSWKTNSALFPTIENLVSSVAAFFVFPDQLATVSAFVSRAGIAVGLGILALFFAWQQAQLKTASEPTKQNEQIISHFFALSALMFLLSPAQFPWYFLWVLPFIPLRPYRGLLLLSALIPLYYASFYFMVQNRLDFYSDQMVWLIWLPVWAVLLAELLFFGPLDTSLRQKENRI